MSSKKDIANVRGWKPPKRQNYTVAKGEADEACQRWTSVHTDATAHVCMPKQRGSASPLRGVRPGSSGMVRPVREQAEQALLQV